MKRVLKVWRKSRARWPDSFVRFTNKKECHFWPLFLWSCHWRPGAILSGQNTSQDRRGRGREADRERETERGREGGRGLSVFFCVCLSLSYKNLAAENKSTVQESHRHEIRVMEHRHGSTLPTNQTPLERRWSKCLKVNSLSGWSTCFFCLLLIKSDPWCKICTKFHNLTDPPSAPPPLFPLYLPLCNFFPPSSQHRQVTDR